MKFLFYLERAWVVAAIASLVVAIVNFASRGIFDNRVYFPIFCAGFCLLLWRNVRGQRKFRDKVFGDGQPKETPDKEQ